jgi:threonine/homoserine/homoserine lactone efflux protein
MAFLIGLLVGFAVCIPPGPVNVVIISQAMRRGFLHGFFAGLLAAVLDGAFCLLAVLGMANVALYLDQYQAILKILAALILASVARRLFRQAREYGLRTEPAPPEAASARPFVGIFFLYVTNPSLYAFWLATAGFVTGRGYIAAHGSAAYIFTGSVFAGCVLWYLILNHYVARYHRLFRPKTFHRIFLALAAVLAVFALLTAVSIFVPIHI